MYVYGHHHKRSIQRGTKRSRDASRYVFIYLFSCSYFTNVYLLLDTCTARATTTSIAFSDGQRGLEMQTRLYGLEVILD